MNKKKILTFITIAAALIANNTIAVSASTKDKFTEADITNSNWSAWTDKWENIKNDYTKIALTPGKNQSELNFAWYSKSDKTPTPQIKIAKKSEVINNTMPSTSTIFTGISSKAIDGYNSNKVTATNLEDNTQYMYSYLKDGSWTNPISFNTHDSENFRLLYVGDPQIGASTSNISSIDSNPLGQDRAARNDAYNWNNTLNTALSHNDNVSFIISAGDQINKSDGNNPLSNINEIEYAGYLSPSLLKSLPVATTIGNHDSKNCNYSFHFNNPNTSQYGTTAAGGDYYYNYGDALFITLNTNNTNTAEHDTLIKKAISENPNAKWRIVTFHHDIYGTGAPHSESDGKALRATFSKLMDDNNIDVVLQGHDHTYSRSFQIKGDIIKDVTLKNGKAINPEGTLYMTANSATGSKYYEMYPTQQSYIAARWQQNVPTYSTIDISDVSFSINTYRVDNNEKIDNTYSIVKSLDKSNLNTLIDKGNSNLNDNTSYTNDSVQALKDALNKANLIKNKYDASKDEISDAYTTLSTAINNLKEKEAEKSTDNNTTSDDNTSANTNSTLNTSSTAYTSAIPSGNTTHPNSSIKSKIAKTSDNKNTLIFMLGSLSLVAIATLVYLKKIKKDVPKENLK